MTSYETLRLGSGPDGIAELTMHRPEKLNAMNPLFFRELMAALEQISADTEVRVCVLSGAGRAFSVGGDITTFPAVREIGAARRHVRLVFDAFHAVERARVPVIAAVHGAAYGGGTEILCACDYVIVAHGSSFGFPEATFGLAPGFGITRGPARMGSAQTWRLASTAEVIGASAAASIGLVDEVVPAAELHQRAHRVAADVAALPPVAIEAIKAHLHRGSADGLQAAVELTAALFTSSASQEAVQEFVASRQRGPEQPI